MKRDADKRLCARPSRPFCTRALPRLRHGPPARSQCIGADSALISPNTIAGHAEASGTVWDLAPGTAGTFEINTMVELSCVRPRGQEAVLIAEQQLAGLRKPDPFPLPQIVGRSSGSMLPRIAFATSLYNTPNPQHPGTLSERAYQYKPRHLLRSS